ncbi:MAG: DUF1461 domain-containing protein [Candidatus Woesearchaeota archaeon]
MKKNNLKRVMTALIILLCMSTAVMIYLSNIQSTTFNQALYESKYDEYGIYSRFPEGTDLSTPTTDLIGYMESGSGILQSDFFNEKEKAHMIEVRALFMTLQHILNIAIITSMVSLFLILYLLRHLHIKLSEKGMDQLLKGVFTRFLIWTGWIVDSIAIIMGMVALTFNTSFVRFHEIFFRTDTWMLNPATDNMINMFPQEFFLYMFTRIVMMSILFATVMLVAGYLIRLGVPESIKERINEFR